MHLRDERKARVRLIQALLAILVLSSSCKGGTKALSVDEVLNASVRVPIHYLDPNSSTDYGELNIVYYYSDDSSEALLITYFTTENPEGLTLRVARMSTCKYCGQLVGIDETRGEAPAPVTWARGYTGACRAHPPTYKSDPFAGDPFQSCLYWVDKDLNQYKFYTVWSEEEAVNFANALVVLEKGSE